MGDKMFSDRPDCIKLADEIYLFKGYIPKEINDKFVKILDAIDPKLFWEDTDSIEWYYDKMSPEIPEAIELYELVSELIYPEYVINPQNKIITSRPGQAGMFVHCDSPGHDHADMLTQTDSYKTCSLISYGVVTYLGDFTGGEVFYPLIKENGEVKDGKAEYPDLTYKPEPGDVLIHHAEHPYEHGTKPVLSGTRYAYSCFATATNIAPNTFYHYKTEEYKKNIPDRSDASLNKWLYGLNG
jgi:hypothetical protein